MSRTRVLAIVAVAAIVFAAPAAAQTAPSQPRLQNRELTIGALFATPASLGTTSADLTRSDGSPFELFRSKNQFGTRLGLEAVLTFPLTPRFAIEGAGSWTRGDVESRIESDVESADLVTASTSLSRFTVEGGALVSLMRRPRLVWFARGTAGWMRELTGGNVIVEDGVIGNVGTGVKYWWREPAVGRRGMGFRVEARANARSKGVPLGEDKLRVAGLLFGGLVVGW